MFAAACGICATPSRLTDLAAGKEFRGGREEWFGQQTEAPVARGERVPMPVSDAQNALRNTDLEAALIVARAGDACARPNSAAAYERARRVMPGGDTRSTLH